MKYENLPAWIRRDDLGDDYAALVRGMLDQASAASLPVTGSIALLIERIASMTLAVRAAEAGDTLEPVDLRGLQRALRQYLAEWNTQLKLARSSLTPEQRHVAAVLAAVEAAFREAQPQVSESSRPDMELFCQILAVKIREFGA
ncbi:MAG TPA: hypothetical protein VF060_23500 [Trebonia sp.]